MFEEGYNWAQVNWKYQKSPLYSELLMETSIINLKPLETPKRHKDELQTNLGVSETVLSQKKNNEIVVSLFWNCLLGF